MKSSVTVIDITHLSVERDTTILNDISWQVSAGQNWVILGENGAGKTTLLQTLTAYVTPSSGIIRVCRKTYGEYNWPELRRKIGLVTNTLTHQIKPGETVLETVISGKYAMINYCDTVHPRDKKMARHILDKVECSHIAPRLWGHLSQGEKQRVLIGRALMADLALLILDEPCAGLDPVARERFLGFIDRFTAKKSSPPVILVTHHVEEITPAFTHVLLLKSGCILAAGPRGRVMNSSLLSSAFDARVTLHRRNGRYLLTVHPLHAMDL